MLDVNIIYVFHLVQTILFIIKYNLFEKQNLFKQKRI